MADKAKPVAIEADAVPPSPPGRGYPEPFASRVAGRVRRPLGDVFGLTHFGVNLTRLPPGGMSALRHTHRSEDEFVYILEGNPILATNEGETALRLPPSRRSPRRLRVSYRLDEERFLRWTVQDGERRLKNDAPLGRLR